MSIQNSEGKAFFRYIPFPHARGHWVQHKKTKRVLGTVGLRFHSSKDPGFRGYNTMQGERGVRGDEVEEANVLGFFLTVFGIAKNDSSQKGSDPRLH
jgi:hypothetical protein